MTDAVPAAARRVRAAVVPGAAPLVFVCPPSDGVPELEVVR